MPKRYVVDHVVDLGKKTATRYSELAEIRDLFYPATVSPGAEFDVDYWGYNISSTSLTLWGEIMDTDAGIVVPGSEWEVDVAPGVGFFSTTHFQPITEDLHGKVYLGHVEVPPPPPPLWKIIVSFLPAVGGLLAYKIAE